MLVDMDFRRPRLHSIFRLPNEKGLSDYMCGKIQLDAALQDAPYPNLRDCNGRLKPGCNILNGWHRSKSARLLERLDKECDYVLIDAPALLSVADPAVIATQADAVILVVARRKTGRKHLRFALQQLAELKAKVAGIVVNKIPNSQLYSYYSSKRSKEDPIPAGKSTTRTAVDARSNGSGAHNEQVDAVPQLRTPPLSLIRPSAGQAWPVPGLVNETAAGTGRSDERGRRAGCDRLDVLCRQCQVIGWVGRRPRLCSPDHAMA